MTASLRVKGLSSGYGTSKVINDISFALAQSEVLAVVGKNGMGKTSLLKTILGFLPAWQGSVSFAGRDVTQMPPHLKRRLGMVYVPQEQALFQDLTILATIFDWACCRTTISDRRLRMLTYGSRC